MLEELRAGVSTMLVENYPKSPLSVDKPQGGNRLGHRRKTQERLSAGAETPKEDVRTSRGRQGRGLRRKRPG